MAKHVYSDDEVRQLIKDENVRFFTVNVYGSFWNNQKC